MELQIVLVIYGLCYTRGVYSQTLTPAAVTVVENESVMLTCTHTAGTTTAIRWISSSQPNVVPIMGGPDCIATGYLNNTNEYDWSCGENVITLTLKRVVQNQENETWKCTLGDKDSNEATIHVQVPVTSITMSSPVQDTVTVAENNEVMFVCETSGERPAATITWYKDAGTNPEQEITVNTSSSTSSVNNLAKSVSTLKLFPSRSDTDMKIYCSVNNIQGRTPLLSSRRPQLNVQYPPTTNPSITSFNNGGTYRVIEQNQGTLACSITGGNPLATLTWNCYNSGTDSVTSGQTVTKTVKWTATGESNRRCTCRSSHIIAGNQLVYVEVQILYPPNTPTLTINSTPVSGTVNIINGKRLDVSCQSSSKPAPIYNWSLPNQSTLVGQTVAINNIQTTNNGQYSCKAENTMNPSTGSQLQGNNSSTIEVLVLFPPTAITLNYDSTSGQVITSGPVYVIRGDNVVIACTSAGLPDPTYTWKHGDQSSIGRLLNLPSIQIDRTGTCTATNTMVQTTAVGGSETKSSTATVSISVMYSPTVPSVKFNYASGSPIDVADSVSVIKGRSFELVCSATSNPLPSYSWTGSVTATSATLQINNVDIQQGVQYTCIAKTTMRRSFGSTHNAQKNKSIDVSVLYPATVGVLNDRNDPEGSGLSLMCPYTAGNPSTTVFKWTRDGDSREWNVRELTIYNVTQNDDMSYTCTIYNTMQPTNEPVKEEHSSVSFHLNVLFKASIKSFYVSGFEGQDMVTVDENTDVPFVCNVASNPASNIALLFRTDAIQTQEHIKSLTHNRHAVTCLDAGIYTCVGSNTYNSGHPSTADMKLYVNCHPHLFGSVSENVTSAQNTPATLSVTTLAYPIPEQTAFKWQKFNVSTWALLTNSTSVQISSAGLQSETTFTDVTLSNLTFNNVTQSDFGRYRLHIEHVLGYYTQQFLLQAQDKPDPPTHFKHLEELATYSQIVVQWKPSFNWGLKQTFSLKYKKTSDQDWTSVSVLDTDEETMNYTIGNLAPGTQYQLQIYASNLIGNSSESHILVVQTTGIPEGEQTCSTSVAAVASLSVALVALVCVVLVLAVIIIRRSPQKETLRTEQNGRPEYSNVQLPAGSQSRNEYEHVQGDHLQNSSTYESLQQGNDAPSTYCSLTSVAEVETPVDNKTYENLQLRNMHQ